MIIEQLEGAVALQEGAMKTIQTRLEATQSSLLVLEDHLTTLEEEDEDDDDLEHQSSFSSPSSLQPNAGFTPSAAVDSVSEASNNSQRSDMERKGQLDSELDGKSSAAGAASGQDDAAQAAFVNTIDTLFPPAQEISDADAAAAEQMLCEDPYELFERSKAALQARAERQSAGQALQGQPPPLPDLGPAQQAPASRGSRPTDSSGGLSAQLPVS